MCGRFDIHSPIEIIVMLFQIGDVRFDLRPNYNVAPSQTIPIVMNSGRGNRLAMGTWGFLPSWAREKKTAYPMINARAETVDTSRSYRDAFASQRCLIPADGFYEWRRRDKKKEPHYIRLKEKRPMALAGLYSEWQSPDGDAVLTAAVITTNANELVRPLHDRMPVIIHPEHFDQWLDPALQVKDRVMPLLAPFPAEELEAYAVTPRINSASYNLPDAVLPLS